MKWSDLGIYDYVMAGILFGYQRICSSSVQSDYITGSALVPWTWARPRLERSLRDHLVMERVILYGQFSVMINDNHNKKLSLVMEPMLNWTFQVRPIYCYLISILGLVLRHPQEGLPFSGVVLLMSATFYITRLDVVPDSVWRFVVSCDSVEWGPSAPSTPFLFLL